MRKRTRTVLFGICLLLFLSTAPSAILYSQGYRFDFEQKKITQTGAFFTKVLPRGAGVYLNGKLRDQTSFIDSSLLIENLLPGKYEIEIKKEGYRTWSKILTIRQREVSEAKHVALFPQKINLEFITKDQKEIKVILSIIKQEEKNEIPKELIDVDFNNYSLSPDKKGVAYFTDHEIMVLFLENKHDLEQSQGNKIFLARFSEKIDDVIWLNNYYIIFNAGNSVKVTEIDNRDNLNMIELFKIEKPVIHWDRDAKTLYVLSENKLYKAASLLP